MASLDITLCHELCDCAGLPVVRNRCVAVAVTLPLHMQVTDRSALKLLTKVEGVERRLSEHPLASSPSLRAQLAALQRKMRLGAQLQVRDCGTSQALTFNAWPTAN